MKCMKRIYKTSLPIVLLLFLLASCIKNDIDYPVIKLQILDMTVKGQTSAADINAETRTVTFNLEESVNLKKVQLTKLELTEGAKTDLAVNSYLDLAQPKKVVLSLYQDYEWTIIGKQTIERKFVVEDQIGPALFDEENHIAVAYVSTQTSLRMINVEDLKLGPIGCTMTPADFTTLHNFMSAQKVTIKYHDVTEVWTLYVSQSTNEVVTSSADGWTNVAWLYGQGKKGSTFGFEICEASSGAWVAVNDAYIEVNGGSFKARVPHLKPSTVYNCRAVSGDKYGDILTFTTGEAVKLPGGTFDDWFLDGDVWNPWPKDGEQFWDTGNKGASSLGESNSVPTSSDTWNGKGKAAQLNSKFVGIASIGKFAAGNLYVGKYIKTVGTNGVLNFGRPFTERPVRLRGHYKYTTVPIDYIPKKTSADYSRFASYEGKPDTCFMYVALGDWDNPVEIRTEPANRSLFNKNDSHIIAYAEFSSGTTVSSYQDLNLELVYRATNRTPKHIVIVCSASKYGDYFTGGAGSTLWVDDFTLEYDYDD